jgi:DNA polymerase-3 subunit gamma/tau
LQALEEDVEELARGEKGQKRCAAAIKDAVKLEAEGIADSIPINHIRRAAAWAHLAPNGKRKCILIENADCMQEGARNSLLKILEEPPASLNIVLTTAHEKALLPTILSRLRPYRFVQRSREEEAGVLALVFGTEQPSGTPQPSVAHSAAQNAASMHTSDIAAYLDSFLPVSAENLRPLAAFFAASVALSTVLALKQHSASLPLPAELVSLGKYTAPIAEKAGFGRPARNNRTLIDTILAHAGNFEIRGLFSHFLQDILRFVSESLRDVSSVSPAYYDIWQRCMEEAGRAVGTYNQKASAALDRLSTELRIAMVELWD